MVIDTTPGLGEHTLVVLEHVTDAIFVSNLGVPALRGLRTELEMLRTLGLLPANRRIVVNQTEKNVGLTVKDAEHILGAPVDIEVPRSTAVLLASNKGVPLIDDDPRDPASRALRALVAQIAPEAADPTSPEKAAIRMSLYERLNARRNGPNASAPAPSSPTGPPPLVSIEEQLGLDGPPPAPGQPAPQPPSGGGASAASASSEQPASDPSSIVDAFTGTDSAPAAPRRLLERPSSTRWLLSRRRRRRSSSVASAHD